MRANEEREKREKEREVDVGAKLAVKPRRNGSDILKRPYTLWKDRERERQRGRGRRDTVKNRT